MPFVDDFRPIYDDHIRKIVETERLTCKRADEIVGIALITHDIWEYINRGRFIIADLTNRNPNVFYELGLAHAVGKDVILLTQNIDDVPFDLKSLRCITYQYNPRGMQEFEQVLQTTIRGVMQSR